jgi:hypothetical protein
MRSLLNECEARQPTFYQGSAAATGRTLFFADVADFREKSSVSAANDTVCHYAAQPWLGDRKEYAETTSAYGAVVLTARTVMQSARYQSGVTMVAPSIFCRNEEIATAHSFGLV